MAKLVLIKLSKRNIMNLLRPASPKSEVRSIIKPGTNDCLTVTETNYNGNDRVIIDAIPDALVYHNRKPGSLSPRSEAFIKRLEAFLEKDFAEHNPDNPHDPDNSHDAQLPSIQGAGFNEDGEGD